jgi:hypothetical protein
MESYNNVVSDSSFFQSPMQATATTSKPSTVTRRLVIRNFNGKKQKL